MYSGCVCSTFVIVPTPTVSVTALNSQTVGQSLMLECNVTTVRGVTSNVDITWSRNGAMIRNVTATNSPSVNDSQVYTDFYTIPRLTTNDDGGVYLCKVFIDSSTPVMAGGSITLDHVTGEYSIHQHG